MIALLMIVATTNVVAQSRQDQPHPNATEAAAEQQEQGPSSPATLQPQPQPQGADKKSDDEAQSERSQLSRFGAIEWSAIVQAVSALVVAIFTGFLVYYSHRGWRVAKVASDAAKESAAIAREAMEIAERAYLRLDGLFFDSFGPALFPTVVIKLTNVGRIPATVNGWYVFILTETGLPKDRERNDTWLPHCAVIHSGQQVTIANPNRNGPRFTNDTWQKILAGTFSLAVYGAIRYDAGFNCVGEMGFGFTYKTGLTRRQINERFALTDIPGYNYST